MNYEVPITFVPRPKEAIVWPCAIFVEQKQVGTLLSYDPATGEGVASLPGELTMADIVRLHVAGYVYLSLDIHPEEKPV